MLIQEFIPRLKANKTTYHNLSQSDIDRFKSYYKNIKKFAKNEVYRAGANRAEEILNSKTILDYSKKLNAMDILLCNIIHTKP